MPSTRTHSPVVTSSAVWSWRHSFVIALFALLLTSIASAATKPNIILILADDLGWTDLKCYGSDLYQTPNIDKLAKDGMKFTQHYSACTVCSPTRAAILTGKYPARTHITDWIPGLPPENPKLLVPDWTKYLPHAEANLGKVFKAAGYTTASIGKWHLGGEEYYPEKQGFDLNIAGTDKPAPPSYFAPWKIPTLTESKDGTHLTDRLGEEAVKFIEQNKDKPFFLYMPHFAVHTPIQGRADLVEKYRAMKRSGLVQSNALYAALVEGMDNTVGQVRQKLDELKLTQNTIIIFTSDNGGRVPTTSNHPLRVGKGSCYEGGTRVPFIISWPGVTKPGSVNETPVISMDYYPTLLEICGVKSTGIPDGVSLVPLLRGKGTIKRDALFWHYPHYQHYQLGGTTPYGAIREGDFKLIEFFDDMRFELYNLKEDLGEKKDLAKLMPEKANQLRARLHAWRKDVGAQMPTKNPAYDSSRPEHTPKAAPKK
ncbi:MAG: N-acetylgalactosamine 6-sulfate sulfatase [Verrucomicrobia bacterium]|jgi:arylsulfatase A-like enzyme|nr:N-acetylgalactosamine 6-sulfate sulfatase [Verrucomicrobiota bacterium]